eukprot:11214627-Lingulodinium_polyedra.AAC.1
MLLGCCLCTAWVLRGAAQKKGWFESLSNRFQIAPNPNQRNCVCAGAWVCVRNAVPAMKWWGHE